MLPYRHIPAELSGLPSDLVTHTSDHHRLEDYSGRKVVVIGSGQSALETAALLHEQGAEVRIVARTPELSWNVPNPERVSLLGQVRHPESRLCQGWRCKFWDTPAAFRLLPREMQARKARTVLGPSGSWWLRDRVDGVIETFTGYHVRKADPGESGIRLFLDGPKETVIDADHVMAGTGFRIDLARLAFLPPDLLPDIATFQELSCGQPGRGIVRTQFVLCGSAHRGQHRTIGALHRRHSQRRADAGELSGPSGAGAVTPPPVPTWLSDPESGATTARATKRCRRGYHAR